MSDTGTSIRLFRDGGMWCALIGADIQSGISAWGADGREALRNLSMALPEAEGQGRQARESGVPATANPYREVDAALACEWLEGWSHS